MYNFKSMRINFEFFSRRMNWIVIIIELENYGFYRKSIAYLFWFQRLNILCCGFIKTKFYNHSSAFSANLLSTNLSNSATSTNSALLPAVVV